MFKLVINYNLLLFVILSQGILSQTIKVYDKISKKPLPFSAIFMKESGLYSDEEGNFSLNSIKSDTITVKFFGYNDLVIEKNKIKDTLFLTPKIEQLNEIVIKASKANKIFVDFSKSAKSFGSLPLFGGNEIITKINLSLKDSILLEEVIIPLQKLKKLEGMGATNAFVRLNVYSVNKKNNLIKMFSSDPKKININTNNIVVWDLTKNEINLLGDRFALGLECIKINPKAKESNFLRVSLTKKSYKNITVFTFLAYPLEITKEYISMDKFFEITTKSFKMKPPRRNLAFGLKYSIVKNKIYK